MCLLINHVFVIQINEYTETKIFLHLYRLSSSSTLVKLTIIRTVALKLSFTAKICMVAEMGCTLSIKTDKCPSPFDPDVYLIRQPSSPVEKKLPLEIRKKISSTAKPCLNRSPQRKWIRSVSVMDTRCSLTTRDKYQIIKSWKGIARDLHTTGVTMFLR